jgi:hypothetical protein
MSLKLIPYPIVKKLFLKIYEMNFHQWNALHVLDL